MITFSPFNPIYFRENGVKDDAMEGYVHIFSTSDHILMQIFHDANIIPPFLDLIDINTGETVVQLNWNTYAINNNEAVSFYELRELEAGDYRLKFGSAVSNQIHITDDEDVLKDTVLIQYSMRTNVARKDIYPILNGLPKYFEIRLYGGFKDDGWKFSIENEQYVTDKSDVVELYAVEATDKVMTIGDSEGEPSWIGKKIGFILVCELLFVDGRRFSKSDDSAVEVIDGNVEGTKFVYAVTLRQARYENASFERKIRVTLRRVPSHLRRAGRHHRKI